MVKQLFERDLKAKISITSYLLSALLAFVAPIASYVLLFCITLLWIIPDTRIEKIYK